VGYNTTQLHPEQTFERHVYHRDQFAHYFRWTHVLKNLTIGQKVLDVGCADAGLLEVMYRNRFKGERYVGLEYRQATVKGNKEKYKGVPWAEFYQTDITKHFPKEAQDDWDIVACFEVLEHVGKPNVRAALKNIYDAGNGRTKFMFSTPCYDPAVGAAENHIIDGVIGELRFGELKTCLLDTGFRIDAVYGTFASIKDYKPLMNDWQTKMFEGLKEYYDPNLLSNLMAPFFPEASRNCLWICSRT